MAKLKAPTPQELYRARKQREEQEKTALLPPGLFNHGNTCFMNSVLQGLIATSLLADLGNFRPIPSVVQRYSITPLLSRRSPLLTNGHGIGGSAEQPWVNTMPIGDIFLEIMHRAWDVQSERRRANLSPKPLLGALGQKYDQYLDFAQQDAHEFLRILLDAMRMEEFDVIKRRQPPSEHPKKRRRTTITPSDCFSSNNVQEPHAPPAIPDDEKLMSLSDMIFGGKLTSILVCQKCKHISQTFEDFNDISLSLKAEDYRVRKRDRLKNLAKRLAFPTASPANTLTVRSEIPRPSSVPPSPSIREGKQLIGHDEPPIADDPRRRSLDIVATVGDELDGAHASNSATAKEDPSPSQSIKDDVPSNHVAKQRRVEILDPVKGKKEKKDDGWSKIGRRISMSVGLTKGSKDRMSRSKNRNSLDMSRPATSLGVLHSQESKGSSFVDGAVSSKSTSEPRISETFQDSVPAVLMSRTLTPSPTTNDYDAKSGSREPSPSRHGIARLQSIRGSSPKPPKPSVAETEYLRRILADITPASSASPFDILKPAFHHPNGNQRAVSAGSAQSLWLSMSQCSGIEECLRLFTAVEVLDGENMVGCRRCWKIANGVYPSKQQDDQEIADDDSDSVEHDSPITPLPTTWEERKPRQTLPLLSPTLAHVPTSMSTPTVSFYAQSNGNDCRSVSSLPTNTTLAESDVESTHMSSNLASTEDLHSDSQRPITPGGFPIPAISTTGPDSPTVQSCHASPSSSPLRQSAFPPSEPDSTSSLTPDLDETFTSYPTPRIAQLAAHFQPTTSGDSLGIPNNRYGLHKQEAENIDESSSAESETSAATSVDTSTSLDQSQDVVNVAKPSSHPVVKKPSRPKPVIMRPAYKRYLIGTPPPVLAIHLKRFQQTSKTHMVSFSHGFKKLDDYVTFPEYLDLTPYLAPKKEDFGLGKKGKLRQKLRETDDKCMYRLYAVVVHIGNMLGGHYIAYTALPNPPPQEDEKIPKSTSSASDRKSGHKAVSEGTKPERQWAYISDTIVRLTTLEEVLKAKAYICMYERI